MYGWMGTILRVNLSDGTIAKENLNPKFAKEYIGARGLGTKYYMAEVKPDIDAFSPENNLIFMAGPLTGTFATSAARYNVVTKGPLTGTIAASNSGGSFGPELKMAGYDGIIFEGKSAKPVYLLIEDDKVSLVDASELWGKTVPETNDAITAKYGEDFKVSCIGPAGEKKVLYAAIMNDKNRAAGRTGVGAVMGDKNLKAVAVKGTKTIRVADPDGFIAACRDARQKLKAHPVTGAGLGAYGTEILVNIVNGVGGFPTGNWQEATYDKADETGGESLVEKYLIRAKGCFGCSIGCGRLSKLNGKYEDIGEGPEYEAAWAMGGDCRISDLGAITKANFISNELGFDPISFGSTLACAMELYDKGYLTDKDLGGPLYWGDADALVDFATKTGLREGFGDTLALGSYRMAEKYGHPELSMTVKKQEMPAYDGRAIQGIGLNYATSNRGGCHVRGYMISTEVLGIVGGQAHKMDQFVTEGKAAMLKIFQDLTALVDSSGLCLFTVFGIGLPEIGAMYRTATGEKISDEELLKAGERIWNAEKLYNLKNGFTKADDTLPPRLLNEEIPDGPAKGKVNELDVMLREYYQLRGWDENGIPTPEKLSELGLEG